MAMKGIKLLNTAEKKTIFLKRLISNEDGFSIQWTSKQPALMLFFLTRISMALEHDSKWKYFEELAKERKFLRLMLQHTKKIDYGVQSSWKFHFMYALPASLSFPLARVDMVEIRKRVKIWVCNDVTRNPVASVCWCKWKRISLSTDWDKINSFRLRYWMFISLPLLSN